MADTAQPADPAAKTSGVPSASVLDDAADRFTQMRASFEQARQAEPSRLRQFDCDFAGRAVRIRTVGRLLGEHVERSTAHLRRDAAGEPALRIDLWDQSDTGITWQMAAESGGAGIDQWFATSPDRRYVAQESPHTMTWLDRTAGHVVGWTPDASAFNLGERARVAYYPVLLWMHDRGLPIAHAGLVGRDGRGVLVVGHSGQGKSTASLAGLLGGLDFVSDDHVWIEPWRGATKAEFVGHGLYASVNVHPGQREMFPELTEHLHERTSPLEDKQLVFLGPVFGQRVVSRCRIVAVAMPMLTRGRRGVAPADRTDALMTLTGGSLIDWSFIRMPGAPERLATLGAMVRGLPCHWLRIRRGRDGLADIPPMLDSILAEADA